MQTVKETKKYETIVKPSMKQAYYISYAEISSPQKKDKQNSIHTEGPPTKS